MELGYLSCGRSYIYTYTYICTCTEHTFTIFSNLLASCRQQFPKIFQQIIEFGTATTLPMSFQVFDLKFNSLPTGSSIPS